MKIFNSLCKLSVLICFIASTNTLQAQKWSIKDALITTPWSETLNPEKVHQEYPRPSMVRAAWQNLNGLWEFEQGFEGDQVPCGKKLKGSILVPFPWESPLSGVRKQFDSKRGWYRREFTIPKNWKERVILHFEAVDWESTVYVNGRCVGTHKGGFDAFSFDITKFLNSKGKQEIIVAVYDPTNSESIVTGKQTIGAFNDPQSCFYTSCSGIWQTVWLESVPFIYIHDVKIVPDLDNSSFIVKAAPSIRGNNIVKVAIKSGEIIARASGNPLQDIAVKVTNPKLWSPNDPFLYDVEIILTDETGKILDKVESYAGMRKISIQKFNDIPRICLNNRPLYQHGPLEQGFWPDGIYTAPSDEAIKWDIENIKDWGFNMIRKHAKIEPERWYYWCDKLGILVWQDMPYTADQRTDAEKIQFETELNKMVTGHWNHPSIIVWTIFNEHWGLYDVERLTNNIMAIDPSRLVLGNSGIDARTPHIDYEVGHLKDNHSYPLPNLPLVSDRRATVNGEYGGIGYIVPGHLWSNNGKYTHKDANKKEAATDEYVKYMEQIYGYISRGLSATVYTQWSDVENEVNGLYTYDRKVEKLDKNRVKAANLKCYEIPLK